MENILPPAGYVRLAAILKIIPISKSAWWAGIKSGKFPAGIKLGPRTTVWEVGSIRSLLESINQGETK